MPAFSPAPRILILRVGAMGDILHALPAVGHLRAYLPAAHMGWAVEPRWATLLQTPGALPGTPGMPLVDILHPVPTREWSRHPLSRATARSILHLRRNFRAQQYDIAIDLQGSLRSAVLARLSGAPIRIGSATPREKPARLFYTHRVQPTAAHVIDQAAELTQAALNLCRRPASETVDAADSPTTPGAPCPAFQAWVQQNSPANLVPLDPAAELWATPSLHDEAKTVVLAPTAGWGAKQWPTQKFGELAGALAGQGHRILINSFGMADLTATAVLQTARAHLSPAEHNRLQLLPATLAQLTAVLRRADLVIAGDTGPLHLAAALGTPAVALFGPTDPARNGPYFPNSLTLRDPYSITDHRRHSSTEAGLSRIAVAQVLEAAITLLQQTMRK